MNPEYQNLFIVGGIVLATILTAFLVNRFFARLIRLSTEHMKNDPTNYLFLRHAITAVIYIVGFSSAVYQVPQLRTLANSMLAGAGILAVAIGFAAQQAFSNIISGVFIIVFKPFRINDRLQVKGIEGIVQDITLRHTVIRDYENRHVLIPNSVISDEIIVNADYLDEKICKRIEIGISYESDLELAKNIMAEEVKAHPFHMDNRSPEEIENDFPEVVVRVISLGDFSVTVRAWAWAKNSPDGFVMACDLLESIKNRFDKEGIEIPYPHRTILEKRKN